MVLLHGWFLGQIADRGSSVRPTRWKCTFEVHISDACFDRLEIMQIYYYFSDAYLCDCMHRVFLSFFSYFLGHQYWDASVVQFVGFCA